MFYFLLVFLFSLVCSIKISPNEYKPLDNPYEDDIVESTEAYHHIITAISAVGYIDYYKGIYYKKYLCCSWGFNQYGKYTCKNNFKYVEIGNYTNLTNINETNHKELLHYGCINTDEKAYQNILFDYRRHSNDSLLLVQIRMTNNDTEPIDFTIDYCEKYGDFDGGYTECLSFKNVDSYTIPNNSFIIYTLKIDNTSYFVQSDNFTTPRKDVKFNFNQQILLYINTEDKEKKNIYKQLYNIGKLAKICFIFSWSCS